MSIDKEKIFFKEIDIIQSIINRMGNNSFLIKGWTITLVVGFLALNKEVISNLPLTIFLIGAILLFGLLDSYYLRQEKLFRKLYDWVVVNREKTDDFMLNMSTKRFEEKNLFCTFFSFPIWITYIPLIILIIIYYCFII